MIYLQLFFAFLRIGAFSFGGGYAAMPLIQSQVIDRYGWLSMTDFTNLVTIAEMTPGPIAVNAATFVGSQTAGIAGALAATAGVILPSCIFVSVLAWLYNKYRSLALMQGTLKVMRCAVVAMILSAGLKILIPLIFPQGPGAALAAAGVSPASLLTGGALKILPLLLFAGAFLVLRRTKTDPIRVMVACGVINLAAALILRAL